MDYTRNVACVLLCAALLACSATQSAPPKRLPLRGVIVSVDSGGPMVFVHHDAVPGYMESMTMGFRLRNRKDASRLSPGDRIEATLVIEGNGSYLEDVRVVRTEPAKP